MNLQRRVSDTFRLCVCALALAGVAQALYAEEKTQDPIALIQKLNSDDFDDRRAASEKLLAMGEAARGPLEQAAASENLELRQAAAALLQKIEKSSVVIFAFDRDGKPAAGAEGDVKLYSTSGQGVNWNEGRNENILLKADGSAKL